MINWSDYRAEERRRYCYIQCPAKLNTVERCQFYDKSAATYIKELEEEIEQMKSYRLELYERMRLIYATPYRLKITLHREKRDTVSYYLKFIKEYIENDIAPETLETRHYSGKERNKAIAEYKQAIKEHAGVACEMRIEKSKWEN